MHPNDWFQLTYSLIAPILILYRFPPFSLFLSSGMGIPMIGSMACLCSHWAPLLLVDRPRLANWALGTQNRVRAIADHWGVHIWHSLPFIIFTSVLPPPVSYIVLSHSFRKIIESSLSPLFSIVRFKYIKYRNSFRQHTPLSFPLLSTLTLFSHLSAPLNKTYP